VTKATFSNQLAYERRQAKKKAKQKQEKSTSKTFVTSAFKGETLNDDQKKAH
jgi:hypothetical protein